MPLLRVNLLGTSSISSSQENLVVNERLPHGFSEPPHPTDNRTSFVKGDSETGDPTHFSIVDIEDTSTSHTSNRPALFAGDPAHSSPQPVPASFICLDENNKRFTINKCYAINGMNIAEITQSPSEELQTPILKLIQEHKKEETSSRKHVNIPGLTPSTSSEQPQKNLPKIIIAENQILLYSNKEKLKTYIKNHFNNHPKKNKLNPKIKNEIEHCISSGDLDKAIKLLKDKKMGTDVYLLRTPEPGADPDLENLFQKIPDASKAMLIEFITETSHPSINQPIKRLLNKFNSNFYSSKNKGSHKIYGFVDPNQNLYLLASENEDTKGAEKTIEIIVNDYINSKSMKQVLP